MATADTRSYSKNYSGLETQIVVAVAVGAICISSFEFMRHKRRRTKGFREGRETESHQGLGSVESWEWGYLFQGRCWAVRPSPPLPKWPLAWVKQMLAFPEKDFLPLVGPDTTLYARFLRGTWFWILLQCLTTLPVLLSIHLVFAPSDVPHSSMQRASLTSLVTTERGRNLLGVHLGLLAWITLTWCFNLYWICVGAFRYRRQQIQLSYERMLEMQAKSDLPEERKRQLAGWRLRTVMVSNIPAPLRSEERLREYFHFYLARIKAAPPPSPGIVRRWVNFFYLWMQVRATKDLERERQLNGDVESSPMPVADASTEEETESDTGVTIEKVLIVRKMTELAHLLERRDKVLHHLEEAHIKFARDVLQATAKWIKQKQKGSKSEAAFLKDMQKKEVNVLVAKMNAKEAAEKGGQIETPKAPVHVDAPSDAEEAEIMDALANTLSPYLVEFGLLPKPSSKLDLSMLCFKNRTEEKPSPQPFVAEPKSMDGQLIDEPSAPTSYPPTTMNVDKSPASPTVSDSLPSIWEALHNLPRHHLDAFQPLVRLKSLFRGAPAPAIDYYTTKLGLLTSLIHESRSRPVSAYIPSSTAFVTFADPLDALKVMKLLAMHPKNPQACLLSQAPECSDIDWGRLMTKTYTGEWVKDWVVNIGVWAFTLLWVIPVTLFVSLFSVQSIGTLWPGLKNYLDRHPTKEEIISSLIPTLLVTGLAILVPLILLLIAKKAHNIVLLSKLHDQIMSRYHKFLVCNVLVFFCIGVTALQTFFASFKQPIGVLNAIAQKFPDAAVFYVGWFILQTAIHAGLELGLLGLPLIVYRSTVLHAATPRKRKAGTRPRTFNFYYWLPNHLIVLFIIFTFAILNPLVIPFAFLYFSVINVVFRHQFLHVYSKAYENNARVLIIRIVRYSFDGLILAQVVFFALMIVLKKNALGGVTVVYFVLTIAAKLAATMFIRTNLEMDDTHEARLICGKSDSTEAKGVARTYDGLQSRERDEAQGQEPLSPTSPTTSQTHHGFGERVHHLFQNGGRRVQHRVAERYDQVRFWTWRLPSGAVQFGYSTLPSRPAPPRNPNPFTATRDSPESDKTSVQKPTDETEGEQTVPTNDSVLGAAMPQAAIHNDPFGGIQEKPEPERQESWVPYHEGTLPPQQLVRPHEKRQAWDDAQRYDLTYENPQYTRSIDNVLWLPINPCDRLDLDETVDCFRAITSEPGAGGLEQWINESEAMSHLGAERGSIPDFPPEDFEENHIPISGGENILLSPGIESRAEPRQLSPQREDIEEDTRSSIFGPRRPRPRRQSSAFSMASTQFEAGGRSFSGGTVGTTPRGLKPTTSRVSTTSRRPSIGVGLGLPSSPPVAGPSRQRMGSVSGPRGRGRAGSVAFSVASAEGGGDRTSHVDLVSQSVFAEPNFSIVLSNPVLAESPREDIPEELGGLARSPAQLQRKSSGIQLEVPSSDALARIRSRDTRDMPTITTREALIGEVIKEEEAETKERVRKEAEESERQSTTRSWATRWFYNTLRHDHDLSNEDETKPS